MKNFKVILIMCLVMMVSESVMAKAFDRTYINAFRPEVNLISEIDFVLNQDLLYLEKSFDHVAMMDLASSHFGKRGDGLKSVILDAPVVEFQPSQSDAQLGIVNSQKKISNLNASLSGLNKLIAENHARIKQIKLKISQRKSGLLNANVNASKASLQRDLIRFQKRLQYLNSISITHASRKDQTLDDLATALSDLMMHTNEYNQAED